MMWWGISGARKWRGRFLWEGMHWRCLCDLNKPLGFIGYFMQRKRSPGNGESRTGWIAAVCIRLV